MKFFVYGAMVVFAVVPACAQKKDAAKTNAGDAGRKPISAAVLPFTGIQSDKPTATEMLAGYAANVDGLLRSFASQMQIISDSVEAGDLTPLEAMALKLEAARAMIARLETISAIYDTVIFSGDNPGGELVPDDSTGTAPAGVLLRARRTISVKELTREAPSKE